MMFNNFAVRCYLFLFDFDYLTEEEKKRRDRRIPREAIRPHLESPFAFLYGSANDQALINCTGLDHASFNELLGFYKPMHDRYMLDDNGVIRPKKTTKGGAIRGKRRQIDAVGVLALVLFWYRTRGACTRGIAMAFGLTSTVMYKQLKFGRRLLLYVLQNHPAAKVSKPNREEMTKYQGAVSAVYPSLDGVWAACDGLKVPLSAPGNYLLQNRYYNGWKSGHYINCVFCFAPDGRIRLCTLNAPGAWHDSTMAEYGVYEKMEDLYNEFGGKVVVDSAFNLTSKPFLIKSSQKDPIGDYDGIIVNRDATSLRQLSEWGMRMIQAQFPRLKDPLPYEECGERKIILQLMVYLYNYNTSRVGINEILNTFMVERDSYYGGTITDTANEVFNN